jgi:NADH:ubiquinone oxidoreductase subunit 5 (subunit L)/multisubunit Na+/H+ antiporter MnhA subunit
MICVHIGLFSGILLWYEVFLAESYVYYDLGCWFAFGSLTVNWGLYIDIQCAHLLLTVCVVSYAVHVYSYVYMKDDPHLPLFMSYLSFFSFFMMYLACSTDLLGILVGWEGIGVFSYLLIGYYTHRLSASKSALKAVVVNRISDGLLLWGILGLYWYHGTTDLDLVTFNGYTAEFYSVAILIGAMGKSAQIGLHVWLADAMEGGMNLFKVNMVFMRGVSLSKRGYCRFVYGSTKAKPLPGCTEVSLFLKEVIAGLFMGDGHLRYPNRGRRPGGNC